MALLRPLSSPRHPRPGAAGAFIDEQSFHLAETCVRDYSRLRAGDGADALFADRGVRRGARQGVLGGLSARAGDGRHGRGGDAASLCRRERARGAVRADRDDPRAFRPAAGAARRSATSTGARRAPTSSARSTISRGRRPKPPRRSRATIRASISRSCRCIRSSAPTTSRRCATSSSSRCCRSRRRSRSARTCWRWPASWRPHAQGRSQRSAVGARRDGARPGMRALHGRHLTHRHARGIDRQRCRLPSRATSILPPVETLLIAAAGGITFAKLGIPAGLVSGSVLAVAIAALAGRQMRVPSAGRARLLRADRHPARRHRHARDAQGHGDLAAQHRGAGGRDHRA